MNEQEFHKHLVQRYTENNITEQELEVFFLLLKEGKLDTYLADAMLHKSQLPELAEEQPTGGRVRRMPVWRRIAVAASVILLLSAGTYFLLRNEQQPAEGKSAQVQATKTQIQPGGNKAVLLLADGSRIVLDSAREGTLAKQGNADVVKPAAGQLDYNASGNSAAITYNTVSTPVGGQYQVTLHDGTKIWLNASSSIYFPTMFSGSERRVQLTGEAYFEVAPMKNKPFIVQANDLSVEVLGTQFNLMAYGNEPAVKATLIEGSVKTMSGGNTQFLKPGQQASLQNGQLKMEGSVDTVEVTAWKNGLFHFRSADIGTILRQVERWYDVEVKYEAQITKRFSGTIPRNVTLDRILEVMELAGGVHFTVDGRKLTISR